MTRTDVQVFIHALARAFSANPGAKLQDYVYEDLKIYGGDAVEFFERIEQRFKIDLRPITEQMVKLPRRWFKGYHYKVIPRDTSLNELIDFIVGAREWQA